LGLGLVLALVLAASPASASAVDSLTGQVLSASGGPSRVVCETGGPFSYTVSGTSGPPYQGTFTESGSGTVTANGPNAGAMTLSATFAIQSGDFLITGSKTGGSGTACQDMSGNTGGGVQGLSYQATIHAPTGTYADQGTSDAVVFTGPSGTGFFESFTSSLSQPVLIAPTSKDQCKNGGWKGFPQFKNQGQCVSFVESKRGT
jgi:hypothetical protein